MNSGPESPTDPREALRRLRAVCRTLILATPRDDGGAEPGVAPFADGDGGDFLVLVSALAAHTANLLRGGRAGVMLVEDEAETGQVFARRRAIFSCRAERVERETPAWTAGMEAMQARHGAIVTTLRDLKDFQLVRLRPESGRLVLGFGRAFRLGGAACDQPEPLGPG